MRLKVQSTGKMQRTKIASYSSCLQKIHDSNHMIFKSRKNKSIEIEAGRWFPLGKGKLLEYW
jgi:hypothetical protein